MLTIYVPFPYFEKQQRKYRGDSRVFRGCCSGVRSRDKFPWNFVRPGKTLASCCAHLSDICEQGKYAVIGKVQGLSPPHERDKCLLHWQLECRRAKNSRWNCDSKRTPHQNPERYVMFMELLTTRWLAVALIFTSHAEN